MKNIIVILSATLLFSFNACSQPGRNVPELVKSAFSQKFPDAIKVKWSKENAREWEAEFIAGGREYSANFSETGVWVETEYKVNTDEIPAVVKTALNSGFPEAKIKVSEVTETDKGRAYEFIVISKGGRTEVVIDDSGSIVKKGHGAKSGRDEEEEND